MSRIPPPKSADKAVMTAKQPPFEQGAPGKRMQDTQKQRSTDIYVSQKRRRSQAPKTGCAFLVVVSSGFILLIGFCVAGSVGLFIS